MTDEPRDEAIAQQIHAPIEVLLQHDDADWTLVMRRAFPHPPEKLWRMITEPELLARWSPIVASRRLDTPGPATCRENPGDAPLDAEVLIADAPRKLVHRWGADVVAWTITHGAAGSILELRQTLSDHSHVSMNAAGWQVCLGRLGAEEDGVDHERVVGQRAWAYGCQELIDHYRATLATAQANSEAESDARSTGKTR